MTSTEYGMDEARINSQFQEYQRRAEETLGDQSKTQKALDEVWKKLKSTAAKPVKLIQEDICLLYGRDQGVYNRTLPENSLPDAGDDPRRFDLLFMAP